MWSGSFKLRVKCRFNFEYIVTYYSKTPVSYNWCKESTPPHQSPRPSPHQSPPLLPPGVGCNHDTAQNKTSRLQQQPILQWAKRTTKSPQYLNTKMPTSRLQKPRIKLDPRKKCNLLAWVLQPYWFKSLPPAPHQQLRPDMWARVTYQYRSSLQHWQQGSAWSDMKRAIQCSSSASWETLCFDRHYAVHRGAILLVQYHFDKTCQADWCTCAKPCRWLLINNILLHFLWNILFLNMSTGSSCWNCKSEKLQHGGCLWDKG